MPYVLNAFHVPCDGLGKVRLAGSRVSCNVTEIPVSSRDSWQQSRYRGTKAHIVGRKNSRSYGDVFDTSAVDQESEVAVVVLVNGCLEKPQHSWNLSHHKDTARECALETRSS
jgi:hypothetical protein